MGREIPATPIVGAAACGRAARGSVAAFAAFAGLLARLAQRPIRGTAFRPRRRTTARSARDRSNARRFARGGRNGRAGAVGHSISAHHLVQLAGLFRHGLRGGRGLLDERRVLLRELVHLRDRRGSPARCPSVCSCEAAAISATMSVTFFTEATISSSVWPDCVDERASRPATLRHAVLDEVLDLLGGRRRAAGEAAHFARHHREAAALLAGARGFHRGVEREEVGLEGDLVDDADDVGDLAARRR